MNNFEEKDYSNKKYNVCLMCEDGNSEWNCPMQWKGTFSTYTLRVCFKHWDSGAQIPYINGRKLEWGNCVFKFRKEMHKELLLTMNHGQGNLTITRIIGKLLRNRIINYIKFIQQYNEYYDWGEIVIWDEDTPSYWLYPIELRPSHFE